MQEISMASEQEPWQGELESLAETYGSEPEEHIKASSDTLQTLISSAKDTMALQRKTIKLLAAGIHEYNVKSMLGAIFERLVTAIKNNDGVDKAVTVMFAYRSVLLKKTNELTKHKMTPMTKDEIKAVMDKIEKINSIIVDRPQRNATKKGVRHAAPKKTAEASFLVFAICTCVVSVFYAS